MWCIQTNRSASLCYSPTSSTTSILSIPIRNIVKANAPSTSIWWAAQGDSQLAVAESIPRRRCRSMRQSSRLPGERLLVRPSRSFKIIGAGLLPCLMCCILAVEIFHGFLEWIPHPWEVTSHNQIVEICSAHENERFIVITNIYFIIGHRNELNIDVGSSHNFSVRITRYVRSPSSVERLTHKFKMYPSIGDFGRWIFIHPALGCKYDLTVRHPWHRKAWDRNFVFIVDTPNGDAQNHRFIPMSLTIHEAWMAISLP